MRMWFRSKQLITVYKYIVQMLDDTFQLNWRPKIIKTSILGMEFAQIEPEMKNVHHVNTKQSTLNDINMNNSLLSDEKHLRDGTD